MSSPAPQVSPFSPRTGFALAFDDLIARLVELRGRRVVSESVNEDSPADLRALRDLLTDAARAVDPLFQRVAFAGGLTSMSGASPYVDLVTRSVEDDLCAEIAARADQLEDERGGEPQERIDRREHSTLNHRQLGISR